MGFEIVSMDDLEDDDELIENNAEFRAMVERSKVRPRKPFDLG